MITQLATEASDFADVVGGALEDAGGIDLVAEFERGLPVAVRIEELLGRLGVWDLQPGNGGSELEAAAAACKAAGRCALPYPIAERLAARDGVDTDAVGVVAGGALRLNHVRPDLRWRVFDLCGNQAVVTSAGEPFGGKLSRTVSPIVVGPWESGGSPALVVVLQSWVLLGMVSRAVELTSQYIQDRHQFGKAIAAFQAVQFRLADMAVSEQSFDAAARYALWSLSQERSDVLTEALALRVSALEAADNVFRSAHQLHGAIGFCDETKVSWLSRHSQALRRLPLGRSQTSALYLERCEQRPLEGLFSDPIPDALLG